MPGVGTSVEKPAENARLIIAVVGDGVPSDEVSSARDHPLNNGQGLAMWRGVMKAWEKSPRIADIKKKINIDIRGYDDGGSAYEAARRAQSIRSDPSVLAVIGHATSGTTRAAAGLYAEADIPLIMPIATSPNVMYRTASKGNTADRLHNVFRLPPSDVPFQSTMLALTATEELKAKRIYLLRDVSEDAAEYSWPLFAALERKLVDRIVAKRRINRDDNNMQAIAESIVGYKTDLAVLCGYGTTAQELMHALRGAYKNIPHKKRPRVLLTDGAKTREVDPSGFDVYVTFPAPDVPTSEKSSHGGEHSDLLELNELLSAIKEPSYETYGYDSLLILAKALNDCYVRAITRSCIINELQSPAAQFKGARRSYFFVSGENQLSEYALYRGADGPGVSKEPPYGFRLFKTVSSQALDEFSQRNKEAGSPTWCCGQ